MNAPKRIAHRGMPRRARENTLASFELALSVGADGIELDVHGTLDGVVVVHHDARITGGGSIADLRFSELNRNNGHPAIPTLSDVLSLVAGRAEMFIEIKGAGMENLVLNALASYEGAHAIHSFDHNMITRISQLGSSVRLGVLFDDDLLDPVQLMRDTGALDVWPHFPLVTSELIAAVHGLGGRVIPWTVNMPRDIQRLAALGVDGICTDDVSQIAGML